MMVVAPALKDFLRFCDFPVKTYQLLESQASENSDWLRSARNRLKALSRQNGGSASNP